MAGVLQNVVKAAKKHALKTVSLAGSSDDLYHCAPLLMVVCSSMVDSTQIWERFGSPVALFFDNRLVSSGHVVVDKW